MGGAVGTVSTLPASGARTAGGVISSAASISSVIFTSDL
jgi:hypothetical protein